MATFEERLSSLEKVVERLERGDLSLEESVSLFEEGVTLSNSCKAELEAAEGRIQVLLRPANGKARVADLVLEEDDGKEAFDDEEDEEE